MKKALVLIAGYPGTGKSFLCDKIVQNIPDFQVVSQDKLKEQLWDKYGFNNIEEKEKLEDLAWDQYYKDVEKHMQKNELIISDYPFSNKQKDRILKISQKYEYEVVTIRLVGNLEVLYQRSIKRDLCEKRHLGHLVSSYHKGDVLKDRTRADKLVTYSIFMDRCLNKGYGTFQIGHLIEIDVTDYSKIDYPAIIKELYDIIK